MNEPMNDLRLDQRDAPWPLRPWLMGLICAIAGLVFHGLVDGGAPGRIASASASGLAVATIAFVLTVELRRWLWALAFAAGWGIIIALIALSTGGYGQQPTVFEWPFFSGIFAVLVAAPLFQAARDAGTLRFSSPDAQAHMWSDAVIGAVSTAFVGVAFLLVLLIAGLFNIIGIDLVEQLLESEWFGWILAGFAFGSAVGLLRERDALVATIHRLAMIVIGVLSPVLAAALVMFFLSLPFTGLGGLWDGWVSAAALMLTAAGGAVIIANAALGAGAAGEGTHPALRGAALVLSLTILPLATLALLAMSLRIGQYGWTPERMWGVLAALVAAGFGIAGWWAVLRDRWSFAVRLQQLQVWLGMGVCAIALILALPIIDFGAISTRDQAARLQSGAVAADDFDWQAMAFDFGPSGRSWLQDKARSAASADVRRYAAAALASENRYGVETQMAAADDGANLAARLIIDPASRALPDQARTIIIESRLCGADRCRAQWLNGDTILVIGRRAIDSDVDAAVLRRTPAGQWEQVGLDHVRQPSDAAATRIDLGETRASVRPITRQRVMVGDRVLGDLPEAN